MSAAVVGKAPPSTRGPGQPPNKRLSLAEIQTKGGNLPSRVILHGVEKIGKTSMAAHAPKPIFLMARGETGLLTLIDAGIVPEMPYFPECQTWDDLLGGIETLTTEKHEYKTLVVDTLNGAERLCHEYVCGRDYGGRWGKDGFTSYNAGYEVALADWRQLLCALDRLRELKGMSIFCLAHTRIKPFRNPLGADYDRFAPELHDKTWGMSHKWADIILFADFETWTKEEKGARPKGLGGTGRILHTTRSAAWDAGNRHNLPPEISMGNNGKEAWTNFVTALKSAKEANHG